MRLWLKSLLWPLAEIDRHLPRRGLVFDLGCGDGFVSQYLAQSSPSRQVIGIDQNRSHISQAQRRTRTLTNLTFKLADITQVNLRSAAACVLSDVLHHLSPQTQMQLLHSISQQLPPQAVCLIKEINCQDVLRSKLSRLWDLILYPHDKIYYSSAPKLITAMTSLGFKVKFQAVTPWFPGSVNLFTCTKQ